jgi:hypothetical protein
MKSCPKCNRTFPDEGQKFCTFDGGLLIAPQNFDPNQTIQGTVTDLNAAAERSTSRELPDPNATIMESYASTVALPRNTAGIVPTTGDLGKTAESNVPPVTSSYDQTVALNNQVPPPPPPVAPVPPVAAVPPTPLPQPSAPLPSAPAPTSAPLPAAAAAAPAKKKSKLPLIILGVLVVLILGGGALGAVAYFYLKPRLEAMKQNEVNQNQNQQVAQNTNTSTNVNTPPAETPPPVEEYVPPLGTANFINSNERLDGKLAEHYFDFSFYYPESWQKDTRAGVAGANSFVKVERRLPPDYTQENFSVGWYTSSGSYDGDLPNFPRRVEEVSNALSKNIPEYRKVSEGPTQVNSLKAYEFRWVGFSKNTEHGDLQLWGRVIFLPTGKEGDTTGATLTMLSTSLATELSSVEDLGVKGEAPVILDSFRFGKKK